MDTNAIGLVIGAISFLCTIGIFLYQENKEKAKITRESKLLTEDIITQIVRNSTQHKISFLQVNIEYLIEGFTKLRSTELGYKITDVLKMIYIKIYENDFISRTDKITILNEIELKIDEMMKHRDFVNIEIEAKIRSSKRTTAFLNLAISFLSSIFIALIMTEILISGRITSVFDVINDIYYIVFVSSIIILIIVRQVYIQRYQSIISFMYYDKKFEDIISNEKGTTFETDPKKSNDSDEVNTESYRSKVEVLDDSVFKEALGEVALIRMYLENEVITIGRDYIVGYDKVRKDFVNVLRKVISVIEHKDDLDNMTIESVLESYRALREHYSRLSEILHFNNNYYIPNEQGVKQLKEQAEKCISDLKDILNRIQ